MTPAPKILLKQYFVLILFKSSYYKTCQKLHEAFVHAC